MRERPVFAFEVGMKVCWRKDLKIKHEVELLNRLKALLGEELVISEISEVPEHAKCEVAHHQFVKINGCSRPFSGYWFVTN
jgi:hypothetical protein